LRLQINRKSTWNKEKTQFAMNGTFLLAACLLTLHVKLRVG